MHCGQTTMRPRRGRVEVKFTCERRRRTALTVLIFLPHAGHLIGHSSVYSGVGELFELGLDFRADGGVVVDGRGEPFAAHRVSGRGA